MTKLLFWMKKNPLIASLALALCFCIEYPFFSMLTAPEPMDNDGFLYLIFSAVLFPFFSFIYFIAVYFSIKSVGDFPRKMVITFSGAMVLVVLVLAATQQLKDMLYERETDCGNYGCAGVRINKEIAMLSEAELLVIIKEPLTNSNELRKLLAINRLGELQSVESVPYLIDMLDSQSRIRYESESKAAARALGNIQDIKALVPLYNKFVNTRYAGMEYSLTSSIAKFGDDAVALITASLESIDAGTEKPEFLATREDYIRLLGDIKTDSSLQLLGKLYLSDKRSDSDHAANALKKFDVKAAPIFAQGMQSDKTYIKKDAIVGLRDIPWPEDVSYRVQIEAELQHKDRNIRLQSARALGRKKFLESKPALEIALANEKDRDVRDRIQWALDNISKSDVQ